MLREIAGALFTELRLLDWRGPRAKYHVTLSVRPSVWHDWQPFQP